MGTAAKYIGRFVIDADTLIPPEVEGSIFTLLRRYEPFIPAWCQAVSVSWANQPVENDTRLADTRVTYEYRRAHITIYGVWLRFDERERRNAIIHEVLHIALAPMALFQDDLWTEMFAGDDAQDGPRSRFIQARHRGSVESVMQDLSDSILRMEEAGLLHLDGKPETGVIFSTAPSPALLPQRINGKAE